MSNPLNLPVDIPWTFIESSSDMMDGTFCNGKSPNPFKSSLAIYAYEPKLDELPQELCGARLTYLKISCTITGYQPTEVEKRQIVRLLEGLEVDYSKIEQIVAEYFGCYGVLLNVSVHPFDNELKKDFDNYPRIIDFEPKTRDFYQAASETGEVLTTSAGKVTTTKSFGSTATTQSSWQAGANASVSAADMKARTGIPVDIGTNASTGQVRTDTDQQNWATTTDASRERKEGQATTTQLNQMYNLLTGYHAGSNRATFLMLPRPHILQPTNLRTFVQGLRIIEGIQDFFLVVLRPAGQEKLQVDAHLQTGHFPENINIEAPVDAPKYDFFDQTFPIGDFVTGASEQTIFGDGFVTKRMVEIRDAVDEANGWEADPTKGDPGRGGVKQLRNKSVVTITEIDFETGQVLGSHQEEVPTESGTIEDVDYRITNGVLTVKATLKASRRTAWQSFGITTFSRVYQVFLRRLKSNAPSPVADTAGLLITQRMLCAQIAFGDCITKIPFPKSGIDGDISHDIPFDLDDLLDIPPGVSGSPGSSSSRSRSRKEPRFDFAFKKGIIRKIEQALVTAGTSPFRYQPGEVGYLQSRHFQKRLLKVIPDKVLDRPVQEFDQVASEGKDQVKMSIRELLSINDPGSAARAGLSLENVRSLKAALFQMGEKRPG